MNIAQAKEEIKHTVEAYLKKDAKGNYRIPVIRQRPILMMGPPGIGKTQIMEQIAEECGIGLVSYTITHHTRQSAVGLPMIKHMNFEGQDFTVTEYTMSEIVAGIYRLMKKTGNKEGILFIDEINCVSETLTPAMLQFLQCKTFGNQPIPKGWIIVAAGNPPEYNKSVREFDIVTMDRVRYLTIEADLEVWMNYATDQHVHGVILSYLKLRPKNFYQIQTDVDGQRFVTARGWEDLSALLLAYEEIGVDVTEEMIGEYLRQPQIAEDFYAYYELYRKYQDDYGIPEILQGHVEPAVYARLLNAQLDERIAVIYLILDALKEPLQHIYETKNYVDSEESERVLCYLKNVFDFMEDAFSEGDGQEMLIFIMGLTMCKEAAVFLAIHPMERYLKYNEQFLSDQRRTKLLQEIHG